MNYSIYKRIKAKSSVFYVKFADINGKYTQSAKSIDSLSKRIGYGKNHITKKSEAIEIVRRAIELGFADGTTKRVDANFVEYCLAFWDFDTSEFISLENRLNINSIGRDYAKLNHSIIVNHVQPVIPKNRKCSQITVDDIEAIQVAVLKHCSAQTWQNVLNALRRPINELRRKHILVNDPIFELRPVKSRSKTVSSVGVLTAREIDKLLFKMYEDCSTNRLIKIDSVSRSGNQYNYDKSFALDRRVYLAVALSAVSGMRMGEIRALRASDIRFPNRHDKAEDMAIITICRAYAAKAGFKEPKGKKSRQVPCPRWLAEELIDFSKTNPHGSDLIFYSDSDPDKPLDKKLFWKWFKYECEQIGIDTEERHIVFHSLRHSFDTLAVDSSKLDNEKVRIVMGHQSESMTRLYYGQNDDAILSIGEVTTKFVHNPKAKEA